MTPLRTLADLWSRNVRLYPDQEALVYGSARATYRELVTRGHQLASGLFSLGAVHGDRVSLLAKNRAEWFEYFLACEMHGFVAATLNFRLAADELHFILTDAGTSHLIFESDYTSVVASLRARLTEVREYICIGDPPSWAHSYEKLVAEGDRAGPPSVAVPGDPVRLIYTSGSTGRPKGVVRTQESDLALARVCAATSDMPSGCRELIMMPMFHIGGQSMASGAHWVGGTVVLQRDFSPQSILDAIEAERVHTLHVTPTILQAILDHPGIDRCDLSSLQAIIYAGAPMSVPLLRRGIDRLGSIFANCYGSTETGATIVLQKRFHLASGTADEVRRIGSLGQEHQDSRVAVLDDGGNACPVGVDGEIAVHCTSMMAGYWGGQGLREDTVVGEWLRTGDVGHMDHDGFVYMVDRKADMIISGGENIYPREVERALQPHPGVKDVAVIGIPDEYWGEVVKAVVVRQPDADATAAELIEYCKTHIARYKAPKVVEFVSQLPLLPSMKIDKVTLRRQHGSR